MRNSKNPLYIELHDPTQSGTLKWEWLCDEIPDYPDNRPKETYYSFDKVNWTKWEWDPTDWYHTLPITLNSTHPRVYFEGENLKLIGTYISEGECASFVSDDLTLDAGGDAASVLLDEENNVKLGGLFGNLYYGDRPSPFYSIAGTNAKSIGEWGMALYAFGCDLITKLPHFPTKEMQAFAYGNAFCYCTELVDLSSFTIESGIVPECAWTEAFSNCTKLEKGPNFLFTEIQQYGCNGMFRDCTALKTTGKIVNPYICNQGCTSMFAGCESLEEVPLTGEVFFEYGSEEIEEACAWMFEDCTKITNAHHIHFRGPMPDGTCYSMFQNCSSLKLPARFDSDISAGSMCFEYMYQHCTSLDYYEPIPSAPEMTWGNQVCTSMYRGTALDISETQDATHTIPLVLYGTSGTNTFLNMFQDTKGSFKGTPETNKVYYLKRPTTNITKQLAINNKIVKTINDDDVKTFNGVNIQNQTKYHD